MAHETDSGFGPLLRCIMKHKDPEIEDDGELCLYRQQDGTYSWFNMEHFFPEDISINEKTIEEARQAVIDSWAQEYTLEFQECLKTIELTVIYWEECKITLQVSGYEDAKQKLESLTNDDLSCGDKWIETSITDEDGNDIEGEIQPNFKNLG